MQAMLLKKPDTIENAPLIWSEIPVPEPENNEIRIRIKACGVCHTDLHTVEGDLAIPKLPIVPGHQIVGIVEKKGEKVTCFQNGQRVGVPWLYSVCGKCEYCQQGLENMCMKARFTGLHVNGGYTEAIVINERFAYPIPESFSDSEATPLLCGGIIGYRALKLCKVKKGQHLGLYGFGGSAHITIQIARHWDCDVYVFTRSESHRKLASKLGACWVGDAKDNPPIKMNSSIIFAPAGFLVKEALRVLDRGGTLALAGVTMTPIPELDYDKLLYWEKSVRSVANFTPQDAKKLLEIAAVIPVHTTVKNFSLKEANKALKELKESAFNGTAVLNI